MLLSSRGPRSLGNEGVPIGPSRNWVVNTWVPSNAERSSRCRIPCTQSACASIQRRRNSFNPFRDANTRDANTRDGNGVLSRRTRSLFHYGRHRRSPCTRCRNSSWLDSYRISIHRLLAGFSRDGQFGLPVLWPSGCWTGLALLYGLFGRMHGGTQKVFVELGARIWKRLSRSVA